MRRVVSDENTTGRILSCRGYPDVRPDRRVNAALRGRYRIERELGEGGMATVYLARDEKHRRDRIPTGEQRRVNAAAERLSPKAPVIGRY